MFVSIRPYGIKAQENLETISSISHDSGAPSTQQPPWADFYCKVCADPTKRVVVLPCFKTHTLCKECLKRLIINTPSEYTTNCPICRKSFELQDGALPTLREYDPQILWCILADLNSDQERITFELVLKEMPDKQRKMIRKQRIESRNRKFTLQKMINSIKEGIMERENHLRETNSSVPFFCSFFALAYVLLFYSELSSSSCNSIHCNDKDNFAEMINCNATSCTWNFSNMMISLTVAIPLLANFIIKMAHAPSDSARSVDILLNMEQKMELHRLEEKLALEEKYAYRLAQESLVDDEAYESSDETQS